MEVNTSTDRWWYDLMDDSRRQHNEVRKLQEEFGNKQFEMTRMLTELTEMVRLLMPKTQSNPDENQKVNSSESNILGIPNEADFSGVTSNEKARNLSANSKEQSSVSTNLEANLGFETISDLGKSIVLGASSEADQIFGVAMTKIAHKVCNSRSTETDLAKETDCNSSPGIEFNQGDSTSDSNPKVSKGADLKMSSIELMEAQITPKLFVDRARDVFSGLNYTCSKQIELVVLEQSFVNAQVVHEKMPEKDTAGADEFVEILCIFGHSLDSIESFGSFVFDPGKEIDCPLHFGWVEILVTLVFDPGG